MIQRDTSSISLWQAAAQPYTPSAHADGITTFDVIIVGGGITGISTALQLQEAGKKCLVLEAQKLCFGTTGGTTAHINTLLDTPYLTIEKNFGKEKASLVAGIAAQAVDLIRTNIEQHAIKCGFKESDAYLFAQNKKEEDELQEIYEASARAGLAVAYETQLPFPFVFTKAMKAANQAKFSPVDYVYALAIAFESIGGVILQECPVTHFHKKQSIEVETGKGLFTCTDLIYATHIPTGINLLHLRLAAYRSYALAVTLQDDNYPEGLAYDMLDPYYYYRSQTIDGKQYLIAGGKDHRTGAEINTAVLLIELEAKLKQHFKVGEVAYKWSSQYFEPADGLPYIGHLPGHPDHIYVATGFGGNGMTYSHVAAILLSCMILQKEHACQELFNPGRIKPVAGFVNFVKNNAEVISNFAGRLFSAEKIEGLAALAPGEGKIVQYEGDKLGVFKDESGRVHAVNPVCTHLKCEVKWNGAERSWDCPCHGGRFNCDGAVLSGPPDQPLEKIQPGIDI